MRLTATRAEVLTELLHGIFAEMRREANERAGQEIFYKADFHDFFSPETIQKLLHPHQVICDEVKQVLRKLQRGGPFHEEQLSYKLGSRHALQKLVHEYARRRKFKVRTKRSGTGLLVWKIPSRQKNVAAASSLETSDGVSISGASSSR